MIETILKSTMVPAVALLVLWFLAALLPERLRFIVRSLGLGSAFVLGVSILSVQVHFPPREAVEVIVWVALASGFLTIADRFRWPYPWLVRGVFFVATTYFVLHSGFEQNWDWQRSLLILFIAGLNFAFITTALMMLDRVMSSPCRPLLGTVILTGLSLLSALSGSLLVGQMIGVACSLLAVMSVLRWAFPRLSGGGEESGFLTLLVGAFSLFAWMYLDVEPKRLGLILSPLMLAWIWPWLPLKTGWQIRDMAILTVLASLPLVLALWELLQQAAASGY